VCSFHQTKEKNILPELEKQDGLGLADLVRRREIKPIELLESAIARIEKRNPKINAVVTKMYDQARSAISAGLPQGPFTGVPYLLKDLHLLYSGVPTTFGSRLFADFVPDHDSAMTLRLRRAGLVICGKTNTPEFGQSTSTEPVLFGPTRNPWNIQFSSGGSSGGSAAAVASGMVPMAHGTDGGGSIRVPASCCGLFGLKTTRARNPYGPDLGEGWSGASVGHAITRSVRDSAALLDATAGPDVGDPYWAPPPVRSFLEEVGSSPGRLKIAVCTATFNGSEVDGDCLDAVKDAGALCQSLGHFLEEGRPQIDGPELTEAQRVISISNLRSTLDVRARSTGIPWTEENIERITYASAKAADSISGADYASSIQAIHRAGRQVGRFFEKYDLLLTPTMACAPLPLGQPDMMAEKTDAFRVPLLRTIGFTALFNAAGNPAMSVPLYWNRAGLPIGIQFAARFGNEATLLRLAAQLEQARPWADRRPDLSAFQPA
jgi:Asp-tRNA(Asn)/Glu-tRNA(Gln) amidotransferase A subunit family amidase